MAGWIHFMFQTASLVSLLVIRLRREQREALRDFAVSASGPGASGHGPASSSESREPETRNSTTRAGHV
jgi:hypothetical protein